MTYRNRSIVYMCLLASVCLLNKKFLEIWTHPGFVPYFMRCYFNDIFGCSVFLLYIGIILSFMKKAFVIRLYHVELFTLICGILWEYITPLYRADTTSDIYDIGAYMFGGLIYWYLLGGRTFCLSLSHANLNP